MPPRGRLNPAPKPPPVPVPKKNEKEKKPLTVEEVAKEALRFPQRALLIQGRQAEHDEKNRQELERQRSEAPIAAKNNQKRPVKKPRLDDGLHQRREERDKQVVDDPWPARDDRPNTPPPSAVRPAEPAPTAATQETVFMTPAGGEAPLTPEATPKRGARHGEDRGGPSRAGLETTPVRPPPVQIQERTPATLHRPHYGRHVRFSPPGYELMLPEVILYRQDWERPTNPAVPTRFPGPLPSDRENVYKMPKAPWSVWGRAQARAANVGLPATTGVVGHAANLAQAQVGPTMPPAGPAAAPAPLPSVVEPVPAVAVVKSYSKQLADDVANDGTVRKTLDELIDTQDNLDKNTRRQNLMAKVGDFYRESWKGLGTAIMTLRDTIDERQRTKTDLLLESALSLLLRADEEPFENLEAFCEGLNIRHWELFPKIVEIIRDQLWCKRECCSWDECLVSLELTRDVMTIAVSKTRVEPRHGEQDPMLDSVKFLYKGLDVSETVRTLVVADHLDLRSGLAGELIEPYLLDLVKLYGRGSTLFEKDEERWRAFAVLVNQLAHPLNRGIAVRRVAKELRPQRNEFLHNPDLVSLIVRKRDFVRGVDEPELALDKLIDFLQEWSVGRGQGYKDLAMLFFQLIDSVGEGETGAHLFWALKDTDPDAARAVLQFWASNEGLRKSPHLIAKMASALLDLYSDLPDRNFIFEHLLKPAHAVILEILSGISAHRPRSDQWQSMTGYLYVDAQKAVRKDFIAVFESWAKGAPRGVVAPIPNDFLSAPGSQIPGNQATSEHSGLSAARLGSILRLVGIPDDYNSATNYIDALKRATVPDDDPVWHDWGHLLERMLSEQPRPHNFFRKIVAALDRIEVKCGLLSGFFCDALPKPDSYVAVSDVINATRMCADLSKSNKNWELYGRLCKDVVLAPRQHLMSGVDVADSRVIPEKDAPGLYLFARSVWQMRNKFEWTHQAPPIEFLKQLPPEARSVCQTQWDQELKNEEAAIRRRR